jgi:hypothetical protein
MKEPVDKPASPWSAAPSAKEKNAVQRSVTALLDALAPEKVLKRGEKLRVPIEEHRKPDGCVLQAASAAVSVSWFADSGNDKVLGELHIVLWRGVLSRRGAPPTREAASMVSELVLNPIERPSTDLVWRDTDGTDYDTASLAAYCIGLLEKELAATQ